MHRTCRQCRASFDITPDDLVFYEKVSPVFSGKKKLIPPPTLCPDCRSQRRLSFRNERNLYRRQCGLTNKPIISTYAPEKPFPVFETEAWYTDAWDPFSYGRPFDFYRPFFDQFRELRNNVPRLSLAVINNENCPYVNQVWQSKNCYMCIDGGFNENDLYCHATYHSKDSSDCAFSRDAERSYDLLDSTLCYHCVSLVDCKNCSDAFFSIDCQQCQNIAFCSNLRGKKYCIFNEEVGKEAFERTVADILSGSHAAFEKHRETFKNLLPQALRRASHNIQCEDCTGDYLQHSLRCHSCFDGDKCQDLKHCTRLDEQVVSSMDVDHGAFQELAYEGLTITGRNVLFTHGSYSTVNHDLLYCDLAITSSDCFGCVGIRNGKYCILNKRYTREEYETLVPKIIEHMRKTGEWGEFFPVDASPYAYNESVANEPEYFPVTKEEARKRGWSWREEAEEPPQATRTLDAKNLPDRINDVMDDILHAAIRCPVSGRLFKVIKQELEFYRKMRLPIPHFHPDERHKRRMALRNPRKLWIRSCMKCGKEMRTTYAPERPEIVYCEECYLKEVY
ncbi:MAG: hypothetical protein PHW10_01285 [Candidatus Peribacteraceae bacterium]|nr:hypothetical protein [Candidatus Peribacteraceae bacterium]